VGQEGIDMQISGFQPNDPREKTISHHRKNEAEFTVDKNAENDHRIKADSMQATEGCTRVGLQTSKHNNLSIEQQLDFCIKNNYSVFEIFFDGIWPSDVGKDRREKIRATAREHGITLQVHGPILHVDKWDRILKETVKFCADVGSTILTLHPRSRDVADYEGAFKLALKKGIKIGLENYKEDGAYYSPEKFIEVYNRFARFPNAGITFDAGHANIAQEAVTYLKSIPSEKIISIHIHDNDGKEDQHLPVGQGTIDFPGLLHTLKERHYQGNLIIERWEPGLESAKYITTLWDKE
jgi:sugar phosphate isomerase/epimerase